MPTTPMSARPSRSSRRRCRCCATRRTLRRTAIIGDPDPMAAVQDALNLRGFDEVIISTLSARISRWLRLDLPSKVAGLGLPVTTVTAREEAKLHA